MHILTSPDGFIIHTTGDEYSLFDGLILPCSNNCFICFSTSYFNFGGIRYARCVTGLLPGFNFISCFKILHCPGLSSNTSACLSNILLLGCFDLISVIPSGPRCTPWGRWGDGGWYSSRLKSQTN